MRSIGTRPIIVCAALLVGLALAYALGRVPAPSAGGGASPPAQGSAEYRYRRIICMSPAVGEIVFAVGAGPRVVGVSEHTMWPPQALKLPVCGGFFNPSFERILSLKPDLVISQGEAADMRQFATANGITLELLSLTNLDSIMTESERIGQLLQVEPQAERLVAGMRARLDAVRSRVQGRPPVGVLLVTGRDQGSLSNIYTVGPKTFLNDLIVVAGGHNLFDDLPVDYGTINKETLLERKPGVIVELRGMTEDEAREQDDVRKVWQGLGMLPAVRNGRVYSVDATYAMIPGPRVVDLVEKLAELFHPEAR